MRGEQVIDAQGRLIELDDDDEVPSGCTLRVPMPQAFRDALSDAARRALERDAADPLKSDWPAVYKALRQQQRDQRANLDRVHRAGFKFADATTRQRREDAYQEMCDRISNAWRGNSTKAKVDDDTGDTGDDGDRQRPAADARARAYAEHVRSLTNAWRR
jgi:hypothetical protein